ncbi:MAG TPA: hypothetical protein VGI87_16795 [Solirubrobacteraceae bacterium]|jgi:hypothetical protein
MGLFSKMRNLTGSVPKELLENGLLGRGIIVSVQQTSVSTGADFDPAHVCVFTVEVALDSTPRYTATCRQAVKATVLPQLMTPGATVAVRVDPSDHSHIALSLGEVPPTVTMAASGDPNTSSAARILAQGEACKAVIVQSQPLGMRNPKGDDMYAFALTILAEGRSPYQIQVGNPVPAAAVPLLYPGNTVPAKRMPAGDDREVVIDWQAALEQLSTTAA